MTRTRRPDPMDTLREAALDQLADEATATSDPDAPFAVPGGRRPRAVEPAVAALFPPGVVVDPEALSVVARSWREATDREAPSIERLAVAGTITRLDADLASGYLAVATADDTWRAFVPRAQLPMIVGLMTRRPIAEVARSLEQGPWTVVPTS